MDCGLSRCRGALAGLAAMLVLGALHPADAGARVRPLLTGITELDDYEPASYRHVKRAGARLVRVAISWAGVAPRSRPAAWSPADPADPSYDWSEADDAVRGVVAAGLTPLVTVDGAPLWAQRCTSGRVCDPDPSALARFARAAAHRYDGNHAGLPRVRYWQGLNEPNLSLFFNPQFAGGEPASPGLYRALINSFYAAVKSVRRSNLVLAAGLGPIAVPRLTIGPLRFTRLLLCMAGRRRPRPRDDCSGPVRFDIFDIHPYTTGAPTHRGGRDDVQLGDLADLQRLLRAAERAGRIKGRFRRTPLWITEFSWDSRPPDPGGLPMPILSRWTSEALYRAWRAGVGHFFWLALRDPKPRPSVPHSELFESGLYFRGATIAADRPKRVLYAFRFPFVAHRAGREVRFWGRTPDGRRGRVAIQVRAGGRWRTAGVARADRAGIFGGKLRRRRGPLRARVRGSASLPFSPRPIRDFRQPPFG